jgi:hypothetical protein
MAAEENGNRCSPYGRGELAKPGVLDPIGEQEIARESILGRRPGPLVAAQSMRQQHPGVDDCRMSQARHDAAEGGRPLVLEEDTED